MPGIHPLEEADKRVSAIMIITGWLNQIRCSIVVSISACHAEDPGSIPGGGAFDSHVSRGIPVLNDHDTELIARHDSTKRLFYYNKGSFKCCKYLVTPILKMSAFACRPKLVRPWSAEVMSDFVKM